MLADSAAAATSPSSSSPDWSCPAPTAAGEAAISAERCVRFAVGVSWTRVGEVPLSAHYFCRRWDQESSVWSDGGCVLTALKLYNTTSSVTQWNGSDIMLDSNLSLPTNDSAPSDIVDCACDSDGIFTVEILLDPPGPDVLGLVCFLDYKQATSRIAAVIVMTSAVILLATTTIILVRPLAIIGTGVAASYSSSFDICGDFSFLALKKGKSSFHSVTKVYLKGCPRSTSENLEQIDRARMQNLFAAENETGPILDSTTPTAASVPLHAFSKGPLSLTPGAIAAVVRQSLKQIVTEQSSSGDSASECSLRDGQGKLVDEGKRSNSFSQDEIDLATVLTEVETALGLFEISKLACCMAALPEPAAGPAVLQSASPPASLTSVVQQPAFQPGDKGPFSAYRMRQALSKAALTGQNLVVSADLGFLSPPEEGPTKSFLPFPAAARRSSYYRLAIQHRSGSFSADSGPGRYSGTSRAKQTKVNGGDVGDANSATNEQNQVGTYSSDRIAVGSPDGRRRRNDLNATHVVSDLAGTDSSFHSEAEPLTPPNSPSEKPAEGYPEWLKGISHEQVTGQEIIQGDSESKLNVQVASVGTQFPIPAVCNFGADETEVVLPSVMAKKSTNRTRGVAQRGDCEPLQQKQEYDRTGTWQPREQMHTMFEKGTDPAPSHIPVVEPPFATADRCNEDYSGGGFEMLVEGGWRPPSPFVRAVVSLDSET